jgi:ribosomal protein S18 acetylase RimI-like enzyme
MWRGRSSARVEEAIPWDSDAIAALRVASYEEFSTRLGDHWIEMRGNLVNVDSGTAFGRNLVVRDNQGLAGAVLYSPPQSSGRTGLAASVEPKDAYLGLLAVSPLARRQGIGLLLAEECEHRAVADGATTIALVTSELMDAARAMYERLDYQPTRPSPDMTSGIRSGGRVFPMSRCDRSAGGELCHWSPCSTCERKIVCQSSRKR